MTKKPKSSTQPIQMRPRIGRHESEFDNGQKKIVSRIRSLPLHLVNKMFAAAEHTTDRHSDINTSDYESLDHDSGDGDVLRAVHGRPRSSLRLVKKLTGVTGRIEKHSDEDLGESMRSIEPPSQNIGVSGVTFAAEPTEMPHLQLHVVQQEEDVSTELDPNPHLTNAPDRITDSTLNLETPPSITSDQNTVFAFFSQSQSSDHGSPNHSNQAAAVSTTDARNGFVNYHVQQDSLPTIQEQGITNEQQKSRLQNCALETTNDRIDEDALSAWWFLGSKSTESIEDAPAKRKLDHNANVNKQEIQSDSGEQQFELEIDTINESRSDSSKRPRSNAAAWILRSFSSEKSHSLRVKGTPSSGSSNNIIEMAEEKPNSSSPRDYMKQSKLHSSASKTRQPSDQPSRGGDYTIKEQQLRREWLVAMGGTVNYDQPPEGDSGDASSVASYQFVPHQTDTLQINTACSMYKDTNKSPDWDPSMLQKIRRPVFNDWTPQDSSYGAAVPAFGCIPKRIRKLIEIVFILVIAAMLIYVVVKLGIILIGNDHSPSTQDLDLWNDDDHYIANSNKNANQDAADEGYNDGQNRLLRRQYS